MDSKQLWDACLGELELTLTKANFTTWFKHTFILECKDGGVTVGVPNAFTKTWMENKYHQKIFKSLQQITEGQVKRVDFKVAPFSKREIVSVPDPTTPSAEKVEPTPPPPSPKPVTATIIRAKPVVVPKPPVTPVLNPRHTFDTFVVGKKTELAYAAFRAAI